MVPLRVSRDAEQTRRVEASVGVSAQLRFIVPLILCRLTDRGEPCARAGGEGPNVELGIGRNRVESLLWPTLTWRLETGDPASRLCCAETLEVEGADHTTAGTAQHLTAASPAQSYRAANATSAVKQQTPNSAKTTHQIMISHQHPSPRLAGT